jgi:hypothetical protein
MNKFLKSISFCALVGVGFGVVPDNGLASSQESSSKYYNKSFTYNNQRTFLTYLSDGNWDMHSISVERRDYTSVKFHAPTAEQLARFIETGADLRDIVVKRENKADQNDFITEDNSIRFSIDKQFESSILTQISSMNIIKKEVISEDILHVGLSEEEITKKPQGLRVTTKSVDGDISAYVDLLITPKYTGPGYNRANISIDRKSVV